jgi:hypothetical protein
MSERSLVAAGLCPAPDKVLKSGDNVEAFRPILRGELSIDVGYHRGMTVQGEVRPNACCSRTVSRMVGPPSLGPSCPSLAPCSLPSRTLRAASRWPAAILDRGCARRLEDGQAGRKKQRVSTEQRNVRR